MRDRDWVALCLVPVAAYVMPAYAADYLTVEQAQRILFPNAQAFVDRAVTLTAAQKDQIEDRAGVRQRWDRQAVWQAVRNGEFLGWFIVDEVIGKHEFITYGVAVTPDGHVLGIEIMSYRETHGGEVRNADWRAQFKGKTLTDPFKLDVDVPNLSGATLSSRNILDGGQASARTATGGTREWSIAYAGNRPYSAPSSKLGWSLRAAVRTPRSTPASRPSGTYKASSAFTIPPANCRGSTGHPAWRSDCPRAVCAYSGWRWR